MGGHPPYMILMSEGLPNEAQNAKKTVLLLVIAL